MKKSGFTLIELLAVIVILAIIALIATPIILGIISDAREQSNERSVELYASAIRNGIATYQLRTGNEVAPGSYTNATLPFTPEYDGNIVCNTIDIYKDSKIYVADCTVNGSAIDYAYGTKKYEPQLYIGASFGNVGATAPENPSSIPPTDKNIYLGYDVTDAKISTAYACFIRNGKEYCLKGLDTEAYDENKKILEDAFKDLANACEVYYETYRCNDSVLTVYAGIDGSLGASYYVDASTPYYNYTIANNGTISYTDSSAQQ
ncbi:MAG: prepilin-type N-terminal cleavage/methylation domain-containing protein [Bacilli bacterium]|nr:prepilin-type N-terminal cleavage/methylation domain-containing protein [Bacilli bacterium]